MSNYQVLRPASELGCKNVLMLHEVLGLDHMQIAIPVGGEPRAVAFYAGLLGLPELAKPEPLAARGGCWFQAGPIQIHLGVEDPFIPAKKAHPALIVSNLDSLVEALLAAGHEVRDGATIDGITQTFTDDPFGNRIELVSAR